MILLKGRLNGVREGESMKRRSQEEGLMLVEKYQASGLTQERFAAKGNRPNDPVLKTPING